ncbi:MAG: GAF domain-containing SpoIIE family protein phosphatase, partial [Planctomycetota bacterium]|nr:GAF domain-containing SpoIIE family protein phosphatase [Planctomycetota bacterium]
PISLRYPTTHMSSPLHHLLSVARALGATDDLRELLTIIIAALRDALHAERASVFVFDPTTDELFTYVAHGIDDSQSLQEIRIPATRGVAGAALQHRATLNIPDAYADDRFNPEVDRRTGFRTRSILALPLIAEGEVIGVAQALNSDRGAFDGSDEELGEALAAQAAVAIRRARLQEDRAMRLKLERDLDIAREIQQRTFPRRAIEAPGYDIAGWNEPAESTGGDAYDIIPIRFTDRGAARPLEPDSKDPAEGAVLLLADATGHGVGPALSVTQLRAMLRIALRAGASLAEAARYLNNQLCEDLPGNRFITAWIGLLDARAHTLTTFSAGQAPLFHFIAGENRTNNINADMMPMGIMPLDELSLSDPISLEPGDIYAVVSDGILESFNENEKEFGDARTIEIIEGHRSESSESIIEHTRAAVEAFTHGAPAADDRTMIIIRRVH